MSAGVRKALGQGLTIGGPHASRRDPRARQPVGSQPRGRGRVAADPRRQDRSHAGGQHAGDDEPRLRSVRGERHAVHLVGVPVAAVVLRPRRQARRRLQVDLSLLLGARGHHRRLRRHVELDRDQQGGRARCGRTTATATRGATRSAASRRRWPRPATRVVDPGRYPNLTDDFSAQISAFKSEKVEIVTGVPIPPDWTTFWKQAAQQGFQPKVATVGKALLFPRSVEALGNARRRHVHRGVVDAAASLQVVADRRHRRRRSRRTTRARRRSSGRSRSASSTRCSRSASTRSSAPPAPRRQGGDRRRDQGHQPRHDRGADQLGQGPGAERHQDAAGRRAVGASGKDFPFDIADREQQERAEHPGRRARSGRSGRREPDGSPLRSRTSRGRSARCWSSTGSRLAVDESEAVGVIGPNGAGKTTALNVMAGRLRPDRGARRLRRPGHHRAAAPRALPRRHRAHASDPASVRGHDRLRERARRARPTAAAGASAAAYAAVRGALELTGLAARGQHARRHADAARAQAPRAGAGAGHAAARAPARRDRRRPHRARGARPGRA